MGKRLNEKFASCRVAKYTCGYIKSSSGNTPSFKICQTDDLVFHNDTIVFIAIINAYDEFQDKKYLSAFLRSTADSKLSMDTEYHKITEFFKDRHERFNVIDPCDANIENGDIPFCRICHPSADPKSMRQINSDQLAENMTMKCVSDPSLIDLLTDMAYKVVFRSQREGRVFVRSRFFSSGK